MAGRPTVFMLLVLLGVTPLIFFTDLTRNPYAVQAVLSGTLVTALWMMHLAGAVRSGVFTFRRTPPDLPLAVFSGIALLSWGVALLSSSGDPSLFYSVYNGGAERLVFLATTVVGAYCSAVRFVDDRNRPLFIHAVLLAGFAAAAYAVLQYFGIEPLWPGVLDRFGGRSVSTFGNPNFLSSYLVMTVPVAFVCYLSARKTVVRMMYLAALVVYAGGLLSTLARSSWAGTAVAFAVLLPLATRGRPADWKRVTLPLLLGAALFAVWPQSRVPGYQRTAVGRLTEAAGSGERYYAPWYQRRLIWSAAWQMLSESPVLGKGWGTFELLYPFYQGRYLFLEEYRGLRTHANNAHNELLEVGSQTGLAGLGAYLWVIAALAASAVRALRRPDGNHRLLAAGLAAGAVGMLVDNQLNVSLQFTVPAFLFWWNAGLLAGLAGTREVRVRLDGIGRVGALVVLVAGAAVIARYAVSLAGDIRFFRGYKLVRRGRVAAALPELEAAARLSRGDVNVWYELANARALAGRTREALRGYGEALKANAGYDEIYYNAAALSLRSGDTGRAVREYSRALHINPLSLESCNALGTVFLSDPVRYAKAGVELFRQCLTFHPDRKEIWNNLGVLYTHLARYDDALAAYGRALELDPGFETARCNRDMIGGRSASAGRLFGEIDDAVSRRDWPAVAAAAARLVEERPGDFRGHFYLGNARLMEGDAGGAVAAYRDALRLAPDNTSVLLNAGIALRENGDVSGAREMFGRVLALEPSDPEAARALGLLRGER